MSIWDWLIGITPAAVIVGGAAALNNRTKPTAGPVRVTAGAAIVCAMAGAIIFGVVTH